MTRGTSKQTIVAGLILLPTGVLLTFLPLALARFPLNKYLVVSGLLIAFIGASCVLHGTFDLIRERRR
jgi:hypothetical protein